MAFRFRSRLGLVVAVLALALGGCGPESDPADEAPAARTLQAAPTLQQTPVWCWAASAEMVFRYYGLPNVNPYGNYQCGLIASWFYGSACSVDCSLCQYPIGPMSNMQTLIDNYGAFVYATLGIPSRSLSSTLVFRALTFAEVVTEIASGRPVVVGISPGSGFALPNASEHIAVLVGYDNTNGQQMLIVNDPFPFQAPPYNQYPNPYLQAGGTQLGVGRFALSRDALVNRLAWANSIYQIR